MVSPDLFDFKRIEWLDVNEMLKYVELEYNKLSENCAALMGDISNSFRASLQNSLQAYKQCRTATSRWAWRWQVWRCRMPLYGDETVRSLEEKRRELLQQLKVLYMEMLKHLRDIVAMLKLGREIMESKIDEKWVHTPHRIRQPNTARRNWQRLLERWSNHCRGALLCLTVSLNSRCSSLTASWLRLPTTRS